MDQQLLRQVELPELAQEVRPLLGAGCDAPQPHLLPPVCQEVCDPLTGGGWHSELGEFGAEDVWDDGVER